VKKDLYLEDKEVVQLIKAARTVGRHRNRDAAMIQIAYSHGLRSSEVCGLRWDRVNLVKKTIHIMRLKDSKSGQHPLYPHDIQALTKLGPEVGWVFKSESLRGPGPVSRRGFQYIVERAGQKAGLGSFVHPHQLRHACGHRLRLGGWDIIDIQEWLGHKNIQNTQLYAQADAGHFVRLIEKESRERREEA
jgi:type 1 fimbriae regulatory protein FimB/type 1 fimbriae regulatory protein FimE